MNIFARPHQSTAQRMDISLKSAVFVFVTFLWLSVSLAAQETTKLEDERAAKQDRAAEVQRGSQTAKGGFQNEDEIRDKFNKWKSDNDARDWLAAMNYAMPDVIDVVASKPHGEKADVEVRVKTKTGERLEGISIKLVSNPNGFNQIDKRWLATYATKWNMPSDVHDALKLFVGETPPSQPSRNPERMFLDEMDFSTQKAVVDFFSQHRDEIVSDLFKGDGEHAATWMMVTLKDAKSTRNESGRERRTSEVNQADAEKSHEKPKWIIRPATEVVRFYSDGEVKITSAGSLKIGRITMQRKGGDNGRESAKMLQFKINPAELFDLCDRPSDK